jgi:hypothetical protein
LISIHRREDQTTANSIKERRSHKQISTAILHLTDDHCG